MGETYEQQKRRLRREFAAARRRLEPGDARRMAQAACARLHVLPTFTEARHLVGYRALDGEIDPAAAVAAAASRGARIYYPIARDTTGFEDGEGRPLAAPEATGLVFLIPGLAFDLRGVRLGRGAGWYDRALSAYPGGIRLGLAYDFQVVPLLPEAAWDVRMHATVTDARALCHASGTDRAAEEI